MSGKTFRQLNPFASFSSTVGWIALVRLIGALGFALSMPFLALFLHEEKGVPMTQVGLMLTSAGLLGAFASTFGGAMSDRFGRRKLVIWIMASRVLSFVGLAYIVYHLLPFHTFAIVYVISAVLGGSLFSLMDAMAADVTTGDQRAEVYGTLRVAANLGWAFGPAIGGILVLGGYHILFVSTAVVLTLAVMIVLFRLKETWTPGLTSSIRLNLAALAHDAKLQRFLLVCLMMFMVRGQLLATTSVHASGNVGLSKAQIGVLFFLNGFLVFLFQVPLTKITKRFIPLKVLSIAGVIYSGGYFIVGIALNHLHMIVGIVLVTLAEIIEAPTASAYVSRLAPEGKTGVYMGSFGLVMHLGWTVGPLLGGVLLDVMPTALGVWGVICGLALCSSVGFRILYAIEPN